LPIVLRDLRARRLDGRGIAQHGAPARTASAAAARPPQVGDILDRAFQIKQRARLRREWREHSPGPTSFFHQRARLELKVRNHVVFAQRIEQRLPLRGIDVKLRRHIGERFIKCSGDS